MLEIHGKYCKDVKIFTDNIEDEAMHTVFAIANHPVYENKQIRIMPDTHQGAGGIVIGFTAPLADFVNPAHIGCDIGCSVTTIFYNKEIPEDTYALVEHKIREAIPFGFEINTKRVFDMKEFIKFMNSKMSHAVSCWPEMVYPVSVSEKYITDMLKRIGMDEGIFYKSIGSIGGGEHDCHRNR